MLHEHKAMQFCLCIPTFRRTILLKRLISDLEDQTIRPSCMIIVDGDPDSKEVIGTLVAKELHHNWKMLYVPSNHANLAYQRYLGWRIAKREKAEYLLYLDDDLRIEQRDAVERVITPLIHNPQVVGVTAQIQFGDGVINFRNVPILQDHRRSVKPKLFSIVRWLGSRTPPGGLSPTGHRCEPRKADGYAQVSWLRGGVMAYRMAAITQDCFSDDLFAMTHIGCGLGEDTFLSRQIGRNGQLLLAFCATFLHPNDALPTAYPIQSRRLAYAIAYSRRFLNDHYRAPSLPTFADRLALLRSYLGNIVLSWGNALLHPARHRFEYALGYTLGSIRGIIQPPSARRLTPHIDWWQDAEEALKNAIEIGAEA